MNTATEHLRAIARRAVAEALERVPLRAALLAGSAGRGDADFYSDIDLLLYVDRLPPREVLTQVREAIGGRDPSLKGGPTEEFLGEEFDVEGVSTEVFFMTVRGVDTRLDDLLDRRVGPGTPRYKMLSGLLEGLPLYGSELLDEWKARIADYPELLRRATVEHHWSFFPVWYYNEAMAARDAELWRLDTLLEAAFNLLGVLGALNRIYFTRFQFKRTREYVARLSLAPHDLADRLESLVHLDPKAAAAEPARLIDETRVLVQAEIPDLDLTLRFPPGTLQRPWRIREAIPGGPTRKGID